jgi:hypothetical protein
VSGAEGEGLGEAVASVDTGLGKPVGVRVIVPRLWVVAIAARITVPSPPPVVGVATGSRTADWLGVICGVGVTSAASGDAWAAPAWRALRYTMVNRVTSTMSATLAATSVGANTDLIESHRPFLRMASLPPCEPSLAGSS